MNKEDIAAQSAYDAMMSKQKLDAQFENLKPRLLHIVLRNISLVGLFLFLLWLHPELQEQSVLYTLLLMIFAMNASTHIEYKKLHERIDALHQIIKHDK